jgi:excisionase family DNA binding protein
MSKRAYQIKEAENALGIGKTKIYELLKTGQLRSVKVGGRRLIPADSIEKFLQELIEKAD